MKTLKTLILFSFLFVCGMNVSADNKSNLIYNSEEVNGMKVAETVYKMDGSTLANYMKYNYKKGTYVLIPEMTITMDNPNM